MNGRSIRTKRTEKCYICGSAGERLYSGLKDRLLERDELWGFLRCVNPDCGLVWLDPLPLKEDIGKAYDNYYTHDTKPVRSRLMYVIVRAVYRSFNFFPRRVSGLQHEKSENESMYLGQMSPGKLLDVGCGDGAFLNKMLGKGWMVEGVDIDSEAAAYAKRKFGINVRIGELKDAGFKDAEFDAVTLRHVIEHVYDPIDLLAEIKRILKPGGALIVATPNIESFGAKEFGANWMALDPPRHLYIFSRSNITLCAEKAGLNVEKVRTSAAVSELVFLGSFDIQRAGSHDLRKFPVIANAFKAWFSQYLEIFKMRSDPFIGEELILIARK